MTVSVMCQNKHIQNLHCNGYKHILNFTVHFKKTNKNQSISVASLGHLRHQTEGGRPSWTLGSSPAY